MSGPKRAPIKAPSRRQLDELPAVLSVAETAAVLRVSRSIVYEALHRGELPGVRLGRRFLVPTARLRELLGEKPSAPTIEAKPMPLVPNGDYLIRITFKGVHKE